MPRIRSVPLALAGGALLLPCHATAATIAVGSGSPSPPIVLRAGSGEVNDVRVSRREGDSALLVHDAGAPLSAGAGCAPIDAHTVACAAPVYGIEAELGDGDDRLASTTWSALRVDAGPGADTVVAGESSDRIAGGDGDDVLEGGEGLDELDGGPGADRLRGGDDWDTLIAGPGADELHGDAGTDVLQAADAGALEADVFDGGGDHDRVEYDGRRTPVAVDLRLAGPVQGGDGEQDTVVAVESASGGAGDDRLTGTDGANVLYGGAGDDELVGGAGNDNLDSGTGKDRHACGDGADVVARRDPVAGLLEADCERFEARRLSNRYDLHPASVSRDRTVWRIRSASDPSGDGDPDTDPPDPVRYVLALTTARGPRTVVARRAFAVPLDVTRRVDVPFTAAGRRLLRRSPGLQVRVSLRIRGGWDDRQRLRWQIRMGAGAAAQAGRAP